MWCRKCNTYINGLRHKAKHRKECGEIVSTVRVIKPNEKQKS